MKRIFIYILLMLTFAGCRTVESPKDYSSEWVFTGKESKKTEDKTWRTVREREISFSTPLTLPQLVDIALANNPETQIAWENARFGEAKRNQADSLWYPRVLVSGNVTREKLSTNPSDPYTDYDDLKYGPGIEITYLLLDFGGRSARVRETTEMLIAANYQFNQAIQDLLLDVENAYYNLYSAQVNLQAVKFDLKKAKAFLVYSENKFRIGFDSAPDFSREESVYKDAVYALQDAKEDVKAAKANLLNLLGMPADTAIRIAVPRKKIPQSISENNITKLIENALDVRPEISAMRARLEARKAAVTEAASGMLPYLTAGGHADKQWYRNYGESPKNTDTYDMDVYIGLKWDVFDGFYNYNRKKAAEAEFDGERQKLIQMELEASSDVWMSYYRYKTTVKEYDSGSAGLESAKLDYTLVKKAYGEGLSSALDLLTAKSRLFYAKSELVSAKRDLFNALAELAHAMGSLSIKDLES